jgi:glutaredoxin 3
MFPAAARAGIRTLRPLFSPTHFHEDPEFLSSHGVPFVAKNVAEDVTAREELVTWTGRMAVPVITVDGEVVAGFDRGRLRRLLGLRP